MQDCAAAWEGGARRATMVMQGKDSFRVTGECKAASVAQPLRVVV